MSYNNKESKIKPRIEIWDSSSNLRAYLLEELHKVQILETRGELNILHAEFSHRELIFANFHLRLLECL